MSLSCRFPPNANDGIVVVATIVELMVEEERITCEGDNNRYPRVATADNFVEEFPAIIIFCIFACIQVCCGRGLECVKL